MRYPGGGPPVLRDLSFEIRPGERVLLLGPSGCGKSSLIYAAAGLVPGHVPAELSGTLLLGGSDPASLSPPERARRAGIVFQDPDTQFCTLSVADEIAFGLENLQTPPVHIEEEIGEVLKVLGITELRGRRPDQLSGGEKQLVALASTLVLRPSLLALDEIAANLDPDNARLVYGRIGRLADADPGLTILCIEHRIDFVSPLIRRVIVLDDRGGLFADGPRDEVFKDCRGLLEERGIWTPGSLYKNLRAFPLGEEPKGEHPPSPNGDKPVLTCRDLGFSYPGGPAILDAVSLDVYPGEILAVLGPNGSGKSTLLRLLAGLEKPNRGRVRLEGKDPAALSGREFCGLCGFVFQNPEHQFVTDTVREEVLQSLKTVGHNEEERLCRARAVLEETGLFRSEDKNPFDLSMGEKRRLSVACAVAAEGKILLLDEPTYGQDLGTTRVLARLLDRRRELGAAVVMVTHDEPLARALADRILRSDAWKYEENRFSQTMKITLPCGR